MQLPWLAGVSTLNRDYLITDYLKAIQGQGIHRSVYVEVDVTVEQRGLEVELIAEFCKKPNLPVKAIVASADPLSDDFEAQFERLRAVEYVRGVRRVLHTPETPARYCLSAQFVNGVRRLGEAGLTFDLCMRPGELKDAAELAHRCPGTQFIVDHCGNADPLAVEAYLAPGAERGQASLNHVKIWAEGMQAIAALPNTVCKLSGVVASLPPQADLVRLGATLEKCIDWFGIERVMFGSDWPVCTLRAELGQWVQTLRRVLSKRSAADAGRVLDENAVRVYRLD